LKPEDLPEDIDGNQDANPYQRDVSVFPNPANRGVDLLALFWREKEYWRHWKRVKRDTGHWPFWSAAFHLIFVLGIVSNIVLFLWARDSQNWSAPRSWMVGIAFAVLWLVILTIGRDVVRSYEAKLYTEHEEEKRHFVARR